ncbi:MAG: prepilin-type N-terminal cleavage/methylation domain-containing protein [Omnitrophica bacterium]|nr:prepilin-type N-terminal cleavage/methylation domain-containing protein [Candidatus Omnitrophota bacterium]
MNKHGLTLMEVIIAALVLSIAVGGVLYIFSTEKGTIAWTGRRVQAMDFGRQTIESLKNEVDATTWEQAGEPLTLQGETTWESLSGDFGTKFSGQRRYRVDSVPGIDPNTGYRSVTITVDWSEPAEPQ